MKLGLVVAMGDTGKIQRPANFHLLRKVYVKLFIQFFLGKFLCSVVVLTILENSQTEEEGKKKKKNIYVYIFYFLFFFISQKLKKSQKTNKIQNIKEKT